MYWHKEFQDSLLSERASFRTAGIVKYTLSRNLYMRVCNCTGNSLKINSKQSLTFRKEKSQSVDAGAQREV